MNQKVFCEACQNDVEYTVTSVPMVGTIRGKEYSYTGMEARCVNCGSLVCIPEISDANSEALQHVYREENGIVQLDAIRTIPEKYAIGKQPLSLLLGWGEHTFGRYFEGDVPTRQYSDMLQRIYNEPQFYAEILETNKGNLKSTLTYEKSRRAVDALITMDPESVNKINAVIQYLFNQCEDVTPMALQKALYYIQGFYYAFYRTFLFTEDCQAWVHGPVYRDVYFRYQDYRYDPLKKTPFFDANIFSAGEKTIFDSVINHLCCYSGKMLERFTHNESPWLITRGDLPINESSDRIIEKKLIGDYFSAVKTKYNMVNLSDIKDYAQDMFRRV